jgi:hypothetical protein
MNAAVWTSLLPSSSSAEPVFSISYASKSIPATPSPCRSRSAAKPRQARMSGKIDQKLIDAHARREIVENIVDGDPQAPDARLAAALAGLDGDDVAVIHTHLPVIPGVVQTAGAAGARWGTRTPTPLRETDFKSVASAGSAKRACSNVKFAKRASATPAGSALRPSVDPLLVPHPRERVKSGRRNARDDRDVARPRLPSHAPTSRQRDTCSRA